MCVLYGGSAEAIFADTGWEHAALYEHIDRVEARIKKIHPAFRLHRIRGQATIHGRTVDNLPDYIRAANYAPSPRIRYCTKYFKIWPIDRFLRDRSPCQLMIGLNAEEGDRVGNHGMEADVEYVYPLLENGITRESCKRTLEYADLLPNFPPYMARGGCIGCFFKSKHEFEALALLSPEEADGVADLEDAMQDGREKHYGIRGGIPSMRTFLGKVRSQVLIPPDEMYISPDSTHTPCGVFCHR